MLKTLTTCILGAALCWAAPPPMKLAKELLNADSDATARVIVQWKSAPDDRKDQKVLSRGGSVQHRFRALKGGVYNLSGSALRDLANDPDVAYITPDRPLGAKLDNTAAAVNASTSWTAGYTGAGIAVAVIDSGINADDDFGPGKKIVYSYDFTNQSAASNWSNFMSSPLMPVSGVLVGVAGNLVLGNMNAPDQYGHGQHVAGIIASTGAKSNCQGCTRLFKGIAPGVNLVDLKVLDQNGQSSDSTVILAIDMAIYLKNAFNIRVINLSLGRPVYESYTQDPLCQAVEAAWKAGITVIVAAGNDGRDNTFGEQGYGTINAPGNDPYVITVGSMKSEGTYTRTDDLVASYSSKGPTQVDHIVKPDLVAPGNLITSLLVQKSTLQSEYPANAVPLSYYESVPSKGPVKMSTDYFILSGTSMAAGVVSGAAADLLQANPSLTPDQVKLLLMQSAYKTFPTSSTVTDNTGSYTAYYDVFTVGAGYLDMAAALANVRSVPGGANAMSPIAISDSGSGAVTLSFDPSSVWANPSAWGSIWGSRAMWGASIDDSNECVFSAGNVLSASGPSASRAMWGASSVWSDSATSASRAAWGKNADGSASVAIGEQ